MPGTSLIPETRLKGYLLKAHSGQDDLTSPKGKAMSPLGQLPLRKLGKSGPEIPIPGLGLMGLSVAYGKPG